MLYAAGLVRDEADVLEANIRHAATFCDRVIYMDNGSEDDSWSIIETLAREMPGKVIAFERTSDRYSEGLRSRIVNEFAKELGSEGWWLKLDADEFLDSNPLSAIQSARHRGANAIRAWQIQFAFTDVDRLIWEAGFEDADLPIRERRRYYHLDWRETRLWQNQPRTVWSDLSVATPPGVDRFTRQSLLNRHYQHRFPEQMQRRIDLRRGSPNFPHEQLDSWQDLVRDAYTCHLHREGERWHYDWRLFAANQLNAKTRWTRAAIKSSS